MEKRQKIVFNCCGKCIGWNDAPKNCKNNDCECHTSLKSNHLRKTKLLALIATQNPIHHDTFYEKHPELCE